MNRRALIVLFCLTAAPVLLIEFIFGFLEASIGPLWPFLLIPWFGLLAWLTRKW